MNESKERPGLATPDDRSAEETGVERFEGAAVRHGGSPRQTIVWAVLGVVGASGSATSADWRGSL